MKGKVLRQEIEKTCFASTTAPTYYDYWVVHEDVAGMIKGTGPDWEGPWSTHLAMKANITREPMQKKENGGFESRLRYQKAHKKDGHGKRPKQ